MKTKLLLMAIACVALFQWQLSSCSNREVWTSEKGEAAVKQYYAQQTDSLLHQLELLINAANSLKDLAQLQSQFVLCRLQYKKTEAISEYYFQGHIQRINGPALPDVRIEDGQVWPPHGFQVLEQILFDGFADSARSQLVEETKILQTDLRFMRTSMEFNPLRTHHVRELIRHEIIRVATLGITGFDAPLTNLSLEEARSSLNGIREISNVFCGQKNEPTDHLLDLALQYLNFDKFDRLEFITAYLMPLGDAFEKTPSFAENADSTMSRPFSGSLSQLMKGEGFNPDYYSGYATSKSSTAKIELGRKLFSDVRLSGSTNMSCVSCHKPELAFTDGRVTASDFVHGGSLPRNTPTLYYAGLQSHQFYDLRSVSLEDQADQVMSNEREFNSTSEDIAKKLWKDTAYRSLFQSAFGLKDENLRGYAVRNALAAYVRSLSPFSSPFDDYMRGDKAALTEEQVHGFNLFAGKAKCATCHFVPLFNGMVPPWFERTESEIIGVPAKPDGTVIDPDSGRYVIHRLPALLFAFKTPGLRNVEKTAPYMHNGVFSTLDEVVEFYNKGGGVGLGMTLPSQTLPFDSLRLDDGEKKAIVAFLQSLTDKKK